MLILGNTIIAPYKDITALMLRIALFKNITLTDAEVNLTFGLIIEENGTKKNNFFSPQLELNTVNSLTISWTIVHPITEESPLFGFTKEDVDNTQG